MKILLATSELFPFSKSGGLADMVSSLALSLGELGHEVQVITPFYQCVRDKFPDIPEGSWMTHVTMGGGEVFGALRRHVWAPGVEVLFLEHGGFYDRPGLYGEGGQDYSDNAARFVFLNKAIWHWVRYGSWQPDIVHVHDWQTALFPLLWKHLEKGSSGEGHSPSTVLTIHNLAYQGIFPSHQYPLLDLPWDYFNEDNLEYYGQWNCLKAGILYADYLTTVSPQYAREIRTAEFGCNLEGVLDKRRNHLRGILNGVDYGEWRTTKNPWLPVSFQLKSIGFKGKMKHRLQEECGLEPTSDVPLFANIGRVVEQKGMDILLPTLRHLLENGTPMQFIQLGTGDPYYERQFEALAAEFPDKVAVTISYNHGLAHRIEAGADFFVMPSRFEPCGLNQLYSLRYGTIPLVRATGGLQDSIVDISENIAEANGLKFSHYSVEALLHVFEQAMHLFEDKHLLGKFRRNGMTRDFSMRRTAESYLEVYLSLPGSGHKAD